MTQLTKNGHGVRLEWMQFAVEYFLCSMNGIGDDDDFRHVFFDAGLIDAASNSEQFRFRACYKRSMMDSFDKRIIGYV